MERRRLLGLASAGIVSIAGCAGSESGEGGDCHTSRVGGDDAGVIQQATVAPRGGDDTILEIGFNDETAAASGTHRLSVYQGDSLLYRIPVEDRRSYGIAIGTMPIHGEYRIVATDSDGTELDTMEIAFNCERDE